MLVGNKLWKLVPGKCIKILNKEYQNISCDLSNLPRAQVKIIQNNRKD